ncbi:MAG: tetratricopeptide repeat protein [Muribaculaceae bacterium]|nr:tetratricopeptide repeat protein [Muribaculaceae bacterium]
MLRILTIICLGAACATAQAASLTGQTAIGNDIDPAPSYSRYLELADSALYYIAKENWSEAARCTRDALRLEPANPGNPMLFSNLGLAAGMEGKIGEAMECFDIALSRAPKSIPVLTSKAKIQIKASDTVGAMETIDAILAIDSLSEWPLQTRGLLRMRSGEYKDAFDDFKKLTKAFPSNSWGPGGMAKCMEIQGYLSEAAGYYSDAISRTVPGDDDRVEFQLGLIENLGHTGKLTEALGVAKEAIGEQPHDGRLYLLRGWIKKLLLIYREAEADKQLAIDYGVDFQTIERFFPEKR